MQNDIENKIEILKSQARSQNRQLDFIQKRIDSLRDEIDKAKRKLDCAIHMIVATMIFCVAIVACMFPKKSFGKSMIIGDSHVGGLRPFLQPYMGVRFKNGTTARYWKRQPVSRTDTLFIMTGTNEQFMGISPASWIKDVHEICHMWRPERCYVIAPPPNKKRNYKAFWTAVSGQSNVIYIHANSWRDGVHLTMKEYKRIANQIRSYR